VETDLEKLNKSRPQKDRPHQDNGPRYKEDVNLSNRDRNARNDRNNRNNRGGRQNDNFGNQRNEGRAELNSKQEQPINSQLNAWKNLPEKLAAEDKAIRDAAELGKSNVEPVNPDDIQQPIYKETFIETSVGDEGRRTGHRATKYVGTDGEEVSKEAFESTKAVESSKGSTESKAVSNADPMDVDSHEVPLTGNRTLLPITRAPEQATATPNTTAAPAPTATAVPAAHNVMDISSMLTTTIANPVPKALIPEKNPDISFAGSESSEDSQDGGAKL
jgi:tRNA pseudouridine13 synthase